MMQLIRGFGYAILATFFILIDVFTKQWALAHWQIYYELTPWLFCEVTFNSGVSWGFLNGAGVYASALLMVVISIIIVLLARHAYARFFQRYVIVGEIMVLSGAVSNMLDRLQYQGVIDFIGVHYNGYFWPIFNIADMLIVGGVGLMFLSYCCDDEI
ncbi:MAG: signal peptidase II [Candidatus Babeliaceae bacterium]|jgi:signal peptidase II